MTPFEQALRERINAEGPLSVEAYMDACNAHYYATRDPLGADGDFTTAPEISQMFGELVGAALADCWSRAGRPENAVFAELGPGRGTLAADALRVMARAGFCGPIHLVETSPALRRAQAAAMPEAKWHEHIEELPDAPLLVAANEFFDALPIRQTVAGIERRVVATAAGLAFDRDGEPVETSPARCEASAALARKLAANGGSAIVVDYGHERSGPGDTLQALRGHRFASLLDRPGEQDLTAHVDFQALAEVARDAGAAVTATVTQGEWLRRLGIDQRARSLAEANPGEADAIAAARRRLCDPEAMGSLFKVMAVHAAGWPVPAGLA